MSQKNAARNREIYTASKNGKTTRELAEEYGLAATTVSQIIVAEKHRRALSGEPIYKAVRERT